MRETTGTGHVLDSRDERTQQTVVNVVELVGNKHT